ncbi:Uncharacterised protein [Corynebacterium matruchotii]|uniref:hypothetical protein n=1 Tax=Corynebacterium matruchotii TaxID=43768 RepID=UPI000F71EC94|nr:hypothetical protein [Corynebacterium matruchotii]VEI99913.1 Uncharacterised protein [Corynebacterium matruchotii]
MTNITVTYLEGASAHRTQTTDIISADRVRYDIHSNRMGWPGATQAPFLALHFCAWAALKREKKTDQDFETWLETVEDVDSDTTDTEDTAPAPF